MNSRQCAHILEWFSKRPDIADPWREQEQTHRRAKRSRGCQTPKFPDTTDFAEHVDGIVTAESAGGGDARERASGWPLG